MIQAIIIIFLCCIPLYTTTAASSRSYPDSGAHEIVSVHTDAQHTFAMKQMFLGPKKGEECCILSGPAITSIAKLQKAVEHIWQGRSLKKTEEFGVHAAKVLEQLSMNPEEYAVLWIFLKQDSLRVRSSTFSGQLNGRTFAHPRETIVPDTSRFTFAHLADASFVTLIRDLPSKTASWVAQANYNPGELMHVAIYLVAWRTKCISMRRESA